MKRSIKNTIIPAILIIVVGIQFFDVDKNQEAIPSDNAIGKHYNMPGNVQTILKTSCYDCHSNTTVYPGYSKVQPVKWWLAEHINDGKRHLNFDEFYTYPKNKKLKKLDEIAETVKTDEMPLKSYTLIHKNAVLSEDQKEEIGLWVQSVKNQISKEPVLR